MFAEREQDSIHLTKWVEFDQSKVDEEAKKVGDIIVALIANVRGEKARRGLPLNAELKRLTVYAGDASLQKALEEGKEDIAATLKVSEVEILPITGTGVTVQEYADVSFVFIDTVA